ncbi:MAG: hypothetical protein NEA02_12860 [Thermoanaerobaculia bacterium]|nr:hypothetical protein [Thermoanaerobaculia bacterium]
MRSIRFGRGLVLALPFVVAGAFSQPAEAQQGLQFYAVTPCRAVDTRSGSGGIIPAATERKVIIKNVCGIPPDAKAVSLNATVVFPNTDGFFSMWPSGGVFPVVSTINFLAGEPALANGAVVPLSLNPVACPLGNCDLSIAYGTASGTGSLHAVLDVTGYFK